MERIKELREEIGLTQKELADAIGVHRTAIAKYESGVSGAKSEVLEKLADFFQVSTDYLLERTNIKQPAPLDRGDEKEADFQLLQEIREGHDTRILFDILHKASAAEIRATVAFLKTLREQNGSSF